MLYIKDSSLNRAALRAVPLPSAPHHGTGIYWRPLNHGDLAQAVVDGAKAYGYTIRNEAYLLSSNKQELYGSVDLQGRGLLPDMGISIGFRHSNASRYAVTLAVGARVFVCSNGMFLAEVKVAHKHTMGLNLASLVENAMSRWLRSGPLLSHYVRNLRAHKLSPAEADHIMLDATRHRIVSWAWLKRVAQEWEEPSYPEFRPRTAWSLQNAFTLVIKDYCPGRQYASQKALHTLFEPLARAA